MTAPQWFLTFLTYAVLLLLLWRGRALDRLAALALLVSQTATPLLSGLEVFGVRLGVAGLAVFLAVSLFSLALTGRRWWLVVAAGVQLVSVASWIYQIVDPDAQVWAAVTFRLIVWMELMALAAFGVCEARYASYAQAPSRLARVARKE